MVDQLPPYLVTPAFIDKDGNPIGEDGVADLEAITSAFNELAQEGWELVTVDQGVAFWRMDIEAVAQALSQEVERCGTCCHISGNLCSKLKISVTDSSLPDHEGCYEPVGGDDGGRDDSGEGSNFH